MNAYDLTDQLIKSDYFLDVNPRNIRRLINIIALTGRLLRAYHIDFNWRVLASWIYLNEQWPYRCSWIVMHYEDHESEFTEQTTLSEIYEKVSGRFDSIQKKFKFKLVFVLGAKSDTVNKRATARTRSQPAQIRAVHSKLRAEIDMCNTKTPLAVHMQPRSVSDQTN